MPEWTAASRGQMTLVGFPTQHPGTRRTKVDFDSDWHGSIAFDERIAYRFTDPEGDWVEIFVGANHRLDGERSLISPRLGLPGSGWQVEAREAIAFDRDE